MTTKELRAWASAHPGMPQAKAVLKLLGEQTDGVEQYQILESELAMFTMLPFNAVCSSGTAALHLALEALRLPLGSRVAVPDFTMIACARTVAMAGHVPVFVDCNEDGLMKLDAVPSNVRAVMVVHVYGRQVKIGEYTIPRSVCVVEDMAELHGLQPHWSTMAACWSFYRNKIVAGEEGGCVASADSTVVGRAKTLRNMGFTERHDYTHVPRGCNYRLSNANAELIRLSLRRFQESFNWRAERAALFDAACPPEWKMPPRASNWVYDFRVKSMKYHAQDAVVKKLQEAGIAARHAFKPMTSQSEFSACELHGGETAYKLSQEVVYLPLSCDPELAFRTVKEAL